MRYEFGNKVSVAATIEEGFSVGARSMPGTTYDGHTLAEALDQVEVLTDTRPSLAVVDPGYRGHGVTRTRVLISGMRKGITPMLAKLLRRRSAIEAEIGHMKTDGRLPAARSRERQAMRSLPFFAPVATTFARFSPT